MDSRRPPYHPHPHPHPPPAPHHPQHPPAPPPHTQHTPLDARPPLPPFSQPAAPAQHPAPPQHPYAAVPPPGAPGPALAPLQTPYAPRPDLHLNLPPFHHQQQQEPPREAPEYHAYHQQQQHDRSGHATPAPVNRSFSHDSSHQQRTPTTPAQPGQYPSASAPDGTAPPPPPPPPHPMEHGGHYGYPPTNGVPHGLPPPHHPHEPPPPHYSTPVMEHPGYPPPSQSMSYYGPASASFAAVQKRKQMRATQACEQCRQRKQKCDEGNPCSFCKEQSLSCQYRDTPPAKTDKNMEKVIQALETSNQQMEEQRSMLIQLGNKLDNLDQRLNRVEHSSGFAMSNYTDNRKPEENRMLEESHHAAYSLKQHIQPEPLDYRDHRTPPHKLLLLWPSVAPLLKDANVTQKETYVMEVEDRGILRLYTRGEGIDEYDGTQPGGPASPPRSDDGAEGNGAPTPPDGLWGTGLPNTPGVEVKRSEPPYTAGGLKPDGSLDLDITTINALYDSYLKNMHIMHPILDKGRLRRLFDRFIQRYCTGHPNLTKFIADSNSDHERPLKRQRSNGPSSYGGSGVDNGFTRKEATERSPGNAIVWLVLALGKICLHRDPLPGPVPDSRLAATNAVIAHQMSGSNGVIASSPISTSIQSPKSTPITQPTPPSADGQRVEPRSRRSSFDLPQNAGARNLDVIPGLAYYAKAVEILGDQGDGNDLVHAQMFLLAGLYKGQLARVKESMSWFVMAGRAIITLLDRYNLYNETHFQGDISQQYDKGQSRIRDKRHSLIVLASWSCLQLETDILAELRLPQSGIQAFEDKLLLPHNLSDQEKESYEAVRQVNQDANDKGSYESILLFYTAQTFLRKRLNMIHREMYGDECLNQPLSQVRQMFAGHEATLQSWRDTLPAGLRWNDHDDPPSDILEARLRAKYWGARYVVNRPFLDYALHIMPHAKDGISIEAVAKDAHGNPRGTAEIHLFKAIATMGEQEVWLASKRCIDAALHSTVAFDGVPPRPVITNIHGTAHAQFGNMLVLAATFYNNWLKTLVPEADFRRVLDRTIRFLRKLQPISPTCAQDCQILEKISKLLWGGVPPGAEHIYRDEREPVSATTSFGHST